MSGGTERPFGSFHIHRTINLPIRVFTRNIWSAAMLTSNCHGQFMALRHGVKESAQG